MNILKFLAACVVLTIRIEEETNSLREAGNMSLWVTHMLRKHGDLMTWKKMSSLCKKMLSSRSIFSLMHKH